MRSASPSSCAHRTNVQSFWKADCGHASWNFDKKVNNILFFKTYAVRQNIINRTYHFLLNCTTYTINQIKKINTARYIFDFLSVWTYQYLWHFKSFIVIFSFQTDSTSYVVVFKTHCHNTMTKDAVVILVGTMVRTGILDFIKSIVISSWRKE